MNISFKSEVSKSVAVEMLESINGDGRRTVFLAIASLADDELCSIATIADVAGLAHMTPAGVKHHINSLRSVGLIQYSDLSRKDGYFRGQKRFSITVSNTERSLASRLADPAMAYAITSVLDGNMVLDVEPAADDDQIHDVVHLSHVDGSMTICMAPEGNLTVPEFMTCMAELRRRSDLLVMSADRRVRAALVVNDGADAGRLLAMTAACNQYGVYYLPLKNLKQRA